MSLLHLPVVFLVLTGAVMVLGLMGCRQGVIVEAPVPQGFPEPTPVNQIRIKSYPASRMARVDSETLQSSNQNSMFRSLFDHIKKNKISMTAPVEMTYQDRRREGEISQMDRETMAFYYRDLSTGRLGKDGMVEVFEPAPATVVSIGLRGSYKTKRYLKAMTKLETWLKEHCGEYTRDGQPRVLAYNSPFIPGFLKYSELQIPVREVKSEP